MENAMKAIELTGTIDAQGKLHLDEPASHLGTGRVRIILLRTEEGDVDEGEWLCGGARNPAFDFLRDPAEDIYSRSDGEPFRDEG